MYQKQSSGAIVGKENVGRNPSMRADNNRRRGLITRVRAVARLLVPQLSADYNTQLVKHNSIATHHEQELQPQWHGRRICAYNSRARRQALRHLLLVQEKIMNKAH